jgi:hypothetical protein
MVSPVTVLCDRNMCQLWREAQVHGGNIVKRTKQWEPNPRFYACAHIDGGVHTRETYMRPDLLCKLPGVGYAAEVTSPVSATARDTEEAHIPGRPTRSCTRTVMYDDEDLDDYSDDDDGMLIGPPSTRRRNKNKLILYASVYASCRRCKDKAAAMNEQMETVQKQHTSQ